MRLLILILRAVVSFVLGLGILAMHIAPAEAKPAPGLCTMDLSRGSVPEDFPIEACISAESVRLRNDLSVPIRISRTGALGEFTVISMDQTPATIAARALINDRHVILPGDIMTIALGSGTGSLLIADTKDGSTYIMAHTLAPFLPAGAQVGQVKQIIEALTDLTRELAEAAFETRNCRANANWILESACDLAYNMTVAHLVGKAIVAGTLSGPLGLIVSTLDWMKLVSEQVPSVARILKGESKIEISSFAPTSSTTSEVVLSRYGIGDFEFDAAEQDVLGHLSNILGNPELEGGLGGCEGAGYGWQSYAQFDNLTVRFAAADDSPDSPRTMRSWNVRMSGTTQGKLALDPKIPFGQTLDQLMAQYPDGYGLEHMGAWFAEGVALLPPESAGGIWIVHAGELDWCT